MTTLFSDLMRDLLLSAFSTLDNALLWMLESVLHVEMLLGGSFSNFLNTATISAAYQYMYTLASGLIVIKFLFKGFQIYVLWRDGDADASPQDMVIGVVQGIIVIISFPALYELMCTTTLQTAKGLMNAFGIGQIYDGQLAVIAGSAETFAGMALIELILALIFIVLALVLCVKMIGRGFELLVLRLGVPIACIGLVDSDFGLFKSYMQIFFKALFTSIIQIVLMSLAFRVMTGLVFLNLVGGISIVITAFNAPMIMQQMLVPSGRGGGISQKVYATTTTINSIKAMLGK